MYAFELTRLHSTTSNGIGQLRFSQIWFCENTTYRPLSHAHSLPCSSKGIHRIHADGDDSDYINTVSPAAVDLSFWSEPETVFWTPNDSNDMHGKLQFIVADPFCYTRLLCSRFSPLRLRLISYRVCGANLIVRFIWPSQSSTLLVQSINPLGGEKFKTCKIELLPGVSTDTLQTPSINFPVLMRRSTRTPLHRISPSGATPLN